MKAEIIIHLIKDPKKQPRMLDAVRGVIELFHHEPVMDASIDTASGREKITIRFKSGPTWEIWEGTADELRAKILGPVQVQIHNGKTFSLDPRVKIIDHDQAKLDSEQKAEDEKKHTDHHHE